MFNVKGRRRGKVRWRKEVEWNVILPTGKESEGVLRRKKPLGEMSKEGEGG